TPAVLAEMSKHDWPGNVRELRNYVERTVVLQKASPTMRRSTPSAGGGPQAVDIGIPFKIAKDAAVDSFERAYLGALLEASGGTVALDALSLPGLPAARRPLSALLPEHRPHRLEVLRAKLARHDEHPDVNRRDRDRQERRQELARAREVEPERRARGDGEA